MSQLISPATPIMINAGTKVPQLASCVLHYNDSDSREGLLNTMRDISTYSSDAAGIGLSMSNIRSKESRISSSGGYAGGLLKYLKIVNESLRFFNQQGRRPGSAAIYLEPWHKDIFDLLDIKKNTGAEELRARDLFTALWLPDNFMKAVKENDDWYLFCPNDITKSGLKPLQECFGTEYDENYNKAVNMGLGKKVKAQEVWSKIIESQIETGVPYLCSKDNANKKTNHQNIGVIKQSNLCNEIYQYTDGRLICSAAITNSGQRLTQDSIVFVNDKLNTELKTKDKQFICISDTDSMYIVLGDLLKHRYPNYTPEDKDKHILEMATEIQNESNNYLNTLCQVAFNIDPTQQCGHPGHIANGTAIIC